MGKAKKEVHADDDDAIFAQRAIELKDEAKALFSKGFILKAAAAYDQALKLVSPDDPRAGEMHRERAACFMYAKQYADVVVECTRALKTMPTDANALFYRAKAYEVLGQGKKAKADAATAAAIVTDDENEKRAVEAAKAMLAPEAKPAGGPAGLGGLGLAPKKDAKSGKEAPLTATQLAERQAAQARQAEALRQRQNQAKWGPPVAVKATCGDDARVVIVPSMISHKDLMTTLQRKFPDQSAFTVRFTDADGASKPLNSRADFATAFLAAQAAKEATKEGEEAKPTLHNLPVLKLSIVEHSSATTTEPDAGEPATDAAAPLAPNEVVEIDEWILDFAALFREHLGIDAEAHLDLHAEGLEKCNEALESPVSMAAADEMLAGASLKFQEAAALALFNWGNVHMCAARKAMDGGRDPPLEEGGPPGAAIATADKFDEVTDRLAQAEGRYVAALEVKPDFHDASIALAQRRYERARLLCAAAGLSGATTSGSVDAKRADEAESEFNAACKDFTTVLGQLPEEEKKEKPKEAPKEGEEAPAEEPSMKAQVLVMWGNTLFEHSQMRARLKKEWKPLLDDAVVKFKDAGCAQADIDQALKVHRGVRAEK